MEVEEQMEGTVPQQAFVEFVDNGELDLNYGGGLLEAEQEPENFPHSASAAYEESPPPRSRHTSQPSSSNKDAAAAAKEHRPISFLEWQKKTHPGDDKEAPVKGDTARSSRHQAQSPRRREPSGSRRQDSAPSQEDRRRHDPHPREPRGSPRHRALTPERQRPASRPRIDERRVMVVPKFVDVNHGLDRRPRSDRPARSARDRTRSPHIHRATLHSRAEHPAAYERRRDPEVSRHAQHVPTRHATEPVWPELHAPPSGRKVEDFVRPHLDRAPLRTPDFAWDAAQYERTSHTVYPAPAEYDYRHGQSDYREPGGRDAGYRASLYREAAYGDAGYAAAQGREVGYRPSSYDYDEPTYRDFSGSRAMDLPHGSYARPDANWDTPRFPDPRRDPYPHGYVVSDDRWNDREQRQLPTRGSPRMLRADRGSSRLARGAERDPVGLSRSGSYPYSRHDSRHDPGHDFLPAREEPGLHAPRLAREYAAPPPRSHRDGLHQGRQDNRDARPRSVSRHVEEYASAGGQHGDPYASRPPPPPPSTSRRPSPGGRSPRGRERSPARATDRHREPTRRSHHTADRPSDRARRSSDRAEPAGREALKLTSRSFAMEAAAASRPAPAPEPVEPGQLDAADLPPPPVGDASKAAPSQAPKPNRASVLVRPHPATDSPAEAPLGGDTSPVLNVQQGFLSEDTPVPADRPFQRGQRSQHPTDATADKSRQRTAKVDSSGSGRESGRRSSRDWAPDVRNGKDAHKASAAAEAKHDKGRSGAKDWVEPTSKRKEASDRRQDAGRAADGKTDKPGAAAKRVSSADRHEREKAKPSSGGKDAPKAGWAHRPAAPPTSAPAKAKDSISLDRPASERKADTKKAPRSPPRTKADPTADKGDKAGSEAGSKGDAVGEKQAGRKRRSRSRELSRSPKRKASSPAARKSGRDSDRREGTSGSKEQHLPPPPARPSSAANDGDLPPPPIRLEGKAAAQQTGATAPNGADQALPPPPPKPHSRNKESTGSRSNGVVNGHVQLDSKTPKTAKEGKPASKPSADAAGKDPSAKDASAKHASAKDASAKDASAKNASAKDAVEKGASKKDALAKDSSAMGASAKAAAAKVTVTKGASAKATNKMSERDSSAGRGSHKASEKASEKATDKGHLVARDSRRSDDRPPAGRSGQKRARSRSPQKPLEGSKAASSTKRQAKASDGKQGDAQHSALQNGTSERSKDADKESKKEWMYEDKGKMLGPVSRKRLLETWQKFKTESKSKAADYLRFPVWRDGSRRAKQQMRDILTV